MKNIAVFFLILLLASCATPEKKSSGEKLVLTPVSFDDLEGWSKDKPAAALGALARSCPSLRVKTPNVAGKASDWQKPCAALAQTPGTDSAARAYFEEWFRPYQVSGREGNTGLFTGYYVPELRGASQRGGAFQTPLYARPADMISVDLGAFKSELKGQHIVGKVEDRKLRPYDDRAAITRGSLEGRALVLAWVDDPVAAFVLQIQGSGRVRLADGSLKPVGYDGANGQSYLPIGRVLKERGEIPTPVTMPAIRDWLVAHPDRAQEIMNLNPSYVFFRQTPNEDVIGAQGVGLTSQRSLAVDADFVPLGTPLWLDTVDGRGDVLQRLMIAQDTGGAIKGVVRGDVFWGAGDAAAAQAGAMQSQGRYYMLLPKTVTPHDE